MKKEMPNMTLKNIALACDGTYVGAEKLEEKVMRKIYIIDQYRTLYGDKDIYEYYDRHKTYDGIEEY